MEARGILGEQSWERNHGRNPDRGNHEGGLLGEELWERNHESCKRIMGHPREIENEQCLGGERNPWRGVMGEESWEKSCWRES